MAGLSWCYTTIIIIVVMVKNFSRNGHKYSNMIADRAALDEILLFTVKGMNSREWQI